MTILVAAAKIFKTIRTKITKDFLQFYSSVVECCQYLSKLLAAGYVCMNCTHYSGCKLWGLTEFCLF